MWYRIGAVRNMTGGRKTDPSTKMNEKLKTVSNLKNTCDTSEIHKNVEKPME